MRIAGALGLCLCLSAAVPAETPVADAAMRGDIAAVRSLLEGGADVNAAQGDGMTALHWAAENGDAALADLLILAGANLEALTRIGGYRPLHLASRGGYARVVQGLLEAGADVMATTETGAATALHFASAAGEVEVAGLLLGSGADIDALETGRDQTPLMFAASLGRLEMVRVLLGSGADPALTTRVLDIPALEQVDRAARQVRNEVLDAYQSAVSAGSAWRPEPDQVRAAVQAAQQVQRTQVEAADAPERVLEAGAEEFPGYTGLVGTQGGLTALLHATREGHADIAMELVGVGADIDQVSEGDHTSPMLMATINGHFDLALQFLELGADPTLVSDAGATPLFTALNTHWAPKARYPQQQAYQQQQATYIDVMTALLEAGVDPNVRLRKHLWYMSYTFDLLRVNLAGATPFWRAAYATDVEAMKLLIAYGADPDVATVKPPARNRGGRGGRGGVGGGAAPADPSGLAPVPNGGPGVWPIHAASGVGYGEGYAGNSHRHAPNGWLPTVKYLVEEMGADVDARDHNGYSPVHHAAARGDNELILYLVERGADVTVVSRRGQTTVDMANGPQQRIRPFPETIALLERLGAKNNHNCQSC